MAELGLWQTAKREVRVMSSRGSYLAIMIVVPIAMCIFFIGLLAAGLPLKVPTAIVDLDGSSLSRSVVRSLSAAEYVDINRYCDSSDDAMAAVRRGDVRGFFVIPRHFESDAVAGRTPTLDYYNNLTYFIPGTLTFKGFKTTAVTSSGGLLKAKLTAVGMSDESVNAMLQPMVFQQHGVGNPWMNYSAYLTPSFTFGILALLIMIMTVFGITMEIKHGTSAEWLATAHGSILAAVGGKMLPHFVVWSAVGQLCLALMFCYTGLPCSNLWIMSLAMELMIIASQAFGLIASSLLPNPRLALSLVALFGVLSFSFTGFSFPVQSMYGGLGVFSYIAPVRYMFLTYVTSGLYGFELYYSRIYLAALLVFPCVAVMLLWKLRKACLKPIYVA